jgi:hypothetical protein
LDASNVYILPVEGKPKSLLERPQLELDAMRQPLLRPWNQIFKAPNQVALYLFSDGSWVIENFGDGPATVQLNTLHLQVPARGWRMEWKSRRSELP